MTLIKTSVLNGIAVIVKMVTLLGINKILAVYVGPSGYAALGQFQNAVQMITTFASGAINVGVTKYTAEFHSDEQTQVKVWKTGGTIVIVSSLAASFVVALLNRELAGWFLKDESFGGVFLWFAIALPMLVGNALMLAILNGKKEIARYVIANIAGSLLALGLTYIFTRIWGLYGALISLGIFQSVAFFATVFLFRGTKWFRFSYLLGKVDKNIAKKLGKYSLMAMVSAACVPLGQIMVRNNLIELVGSEGAGYWEAMTRLSAAYLMLITTTLGVYYLPRLSELQSPKELRREIFQGYKIILPVVVVSSACIYALRDWIIEILFTPNFLPMREIFAWQLIGDTFKIGSWVVSFLMLSKAMFKSFIVTEIIFALSFVLFANQLVRRFGLDGVVIAYAVNYLLYWICISFVVSSKLR